MDKKTILLVDDDMALKNLFADVFRNFGFEVLEAKDGLEALNLVKTKKPDVIFTGIMMPNMDGFELLKMIKGSVETKDIPVLINSHLGREEDRKKAAELGAADFLVKGLISPKQIVETTMQLLEKKIYRVAVDPGLLDAASLAKDLKLKEYHLEIIPKSAGSKDINVKIVEGK